MTTEELLKGYILSHYRSVREFCLQHNIPYSTVDNIFRRGILGSSVSVVAKVCDKLGIVVDALMQGKIEESTTLMYRDQLSPDESRLIGVIRGLDADQRKQLDDYIEFLELRKKKDRS